MLSPRMLRLPFMLVSAAIISEISSVRASPPFLIDPDRSFTRVAVSVVLSPGAEPIDFVPSLSDSDRSSFVGTITTQYLSGPVLNLQAAFGDIFLPDVNPYSPGNSFGELSSIGLVLELAPGSGVLVSARDVAFSVSGEFASPLLEEIPIGNTITRNALFALGIRGKIDYAGIGGLALLIGSGSVDLPEEVEPYALEVSLTRVDASHVEMTTALDIVFSRYIADEIPALSGAVFDIRLTGEIIAVAVVPEVSPLTLAGLAGVGLLLARFWHQGRANAACCSWRDGAMERRLY